MLIFNDDVNSNDVPIKWSYKKISANVNWLEKFVRTHILNPCDEPVDEITQEIIQSINNHEADEYNGQIAIMTDL